MKETLGRVAVRVNPWFVAVLLFLLTDVIIFVAAKVYWTASSDSVSQGQKADIVSARVEPSLAVPPIPKPLPAACMGGVTWVFVPASGRWFKPHPSVPCKLGTVRSENDREGLIVRHPKGWRPTLSNLTQ